MTEARKIDSDSDLYGALCTQVFELRRSTEELEDLIACSAWEGDLTVDEEDHLVDALELLKRVRDELEKRRDSLGDQLRGASP